MMTAIKQKKGFRIFIWLCSIVILLTLIFCAAAGIQWYRVSKSGAKVEVVAEPRIEAGKDGVQLGEKFPVVATFRLPWGINPSLLTAEPADGSQICMEPKFTLQKIRWGFTLWNGTLELQTYAEGEIKNGTLNAAFSNNQNISLKIPAFRSLPVKVDSEELALASKIIPEAGLSKALYWIGALVILAIAGLILVAVLKRRAAGAIRMLTPWEAAVNAIHLLIQRVRSGNVPLEQSVAELTDIVRGYMERRFQLRAERQTTAEFMSDLERGKGHLSDSQRDFLRDFLSAADMVKFARLPADPALFDKAAQKAEDLVRETIPTPTCETKEEKA